MCLGPGLTGLGEKVLDLGNGGLGLHLGEAQAGDKSAVAGSLEGQGPRISLGEVGWTGVLGNCYGRGRVGAKSRSHWIGMGVGREEGKPGSL